METQQISSVYRAIKLAKHAMTMAKKVINQNVSLAHPTFLSFIHLYHCACKVVVKGIIK